MALLELENVVAAYGNIRALKGLTLAVDEGEIVALLGANGAGKSTTLRVISGAPSNVLVSVRRAQEFLDGAWEVLGDPATRERYDEAMGFRRRGGEAVTVHVWHPPAAGPGAQLGAR